MPHRRPSSAVTRNVFVLGAVSFCADVASDMVVPLLPAFLLSLGAGASFLGLVEGLAEATAALFKWLSGRLADRVRRLLPITAAGYALAAVVRPLLAISLAPWHVLAVRCLDRVGKGVRTSPRDKLLAGSTPEGKLAEAFSFHRAMDHAGAALGPLAASALLVVWPGQLRRVFLVAAVPGALAVFLLALVREKPAGARAAAPISLSKAIDSTSPRRVPARLLAAIGIFALGNSTDALLLLRAQSLGVPTAQLPLLWMLLHAVRSLCSWPLGRVADRLGRQGALAAGWVWYAVCYAGFALAHSPQQVVLVFGLYGLVAGLTEGSERALVAGAVRPQDRGRALGIYNLSSGAGLLLASVLAGLLWERVSPAAGLSLGAIMATLAAGLLATPLPAGPAQ